MQRSVKNLTMEQLYRKRAFDRQNQRTSRARKKTRIAQLEDEVADLKRQLAQSEQQAMQIQSNEAALREVINSARLSLQIVDPRASSQMLIPSPPSSRDARDSADREFASIPTNTTITPPPLSFKCSEDQNSVLATTGFGNVARLRPETLTTDDVEELVLGSESSAFTFSLPMPPNFDTMSYVRDNLFSANLFPPMTSFPLPFLDSFSDPAPWITPFEFPTSKASQLMRQWERAPHHLDPSCRLDTVILELFQSSRQRTEKIPEFSGPIFPSIGSLLNPERDSEYSPISNAIGVHGRVTMGMPSLELKIGIMYHMCIYLRWLITPTKQNYEAMPEYLRPLEIQLTMPHPAWIDVIVWPEARERIIRCMDWSEFEIMRAIANHDMSINWPHGLAHVFTASEAGDVRMNPAFERHIRCLGNWTMGGEVEDRFPFLKGVTPRHKRMGGLV